MSVPAADNLRREAEARKYMSDTANMTMHVAADMLEAIDALHQPGTPPGLAVAFCLECGDLWPCTTRRILHPTGS